MYQHGKLKTDNKDTLYCTLKKTTQTTFMLPHTTKSRTISEIGSLSSNTTEYKRNPMNEIEVIPDTTHDASSI